MDQRNVPRAPAPSVVVLKPSVPPLLVDIAPIPPVNDPWGVPPPGYIPGRGRGATGFSGGVSRDDASSTNTGGPVVCAEGSPWAVNREDLSEAKFDMFAGFQETLFADSVVDDEDREADRVFDTVEHLMDQRRKRQRDVKIKEHLQKARTENNTLQHTFSDLKRGLATVTPEEWDALPDIGDVRGKRKKKQTWQRETPNSLNLANADPVRSIGLVGASGAYSESGIATPLLGGPTPLSANVAATGTLTSGYTTPLGTQTPYGIATPYGVATPYGLSTPSGMRTPGVHSSLANLSQAVSSAALVTESKGAVISNRLDAVKNGTMTSIADPKGYITQLEHERDMQAGSKDIKKTRALMKSIVSTNPTNASGWIAYARTEMGYGRASRARDIIAQGCLKCPESEEIWLEAAEMQTSKVESDEWLQAAISRLPNSVKLWMRRADLWSAEDSAAANSAGHTRRQILREALGKITNSVTLWREAVLCETEDDGRILLARAVQCLPQSPCLWLDLVRITPDRTDKMRILNEASRQCPTSMEIWSEAISLFEEETLTAGSATNREAPDVLKKMVLRAIKRLKASGNVDFDRSAWLKVAMKAEEAVPKKIMTAWAIIDVVGVLSWPDYKSEEGVDVAKFKNDRLVEAESAKAAGNRECTLALLRDALKYVPKKKAFWARMIEVFEGTDLYLSILEEAVTALPIKKSFWNKLLEYSFTLDPKLHATYLDRAVQNIPGDAELLLRKIKLQTRSGSLEEALSTIQASRAAQDSPQLCKHHVKVLRALGRQAEALEVIAKAAEQAVASPELWLMQAEIENDQQAILRAGLKQFPRDERLWAALIAKIRTSGNLAEARACREKATTICAESELIWLEAIEIEKSAISGGLAPPLSSTISRALQHCPKSGLLWWERIWVEGDPTRGLKVVEALKATNSSIYAVLAAAKHFELQGKSKKALEWYQKAVYDVGVHNGDAYVMFLSFLIQSNTDNSASLIEDLLQAAQVNKLNQGSRWWLPVHKSVKHQDNYVNPTSIKDQLYEGESHFRQYWSNLKRLVH